MLPAHTIRSQGDRGEWTFHPRHRRTVAVSKRLKEGRSVHLRHPQVAHDQVIPHLLASTEALGSVRYRIDLMAETGEYVDDQ